jgi:hypothetical protein
MKGRRNRPVDVWSSIAIGAPDECWPWTAAPRGRQGYGSMSLNGRQVLAHRIVYELATGVPPGDLVVMHSCDNPPCCNPAHLSLGTVGDNVRDAWSKGRQFRASGSLHGEAKLTEDAVREIRQRSERGESRRSLGRSFGVSESRISQIVREPERNWSHA